jgi:hypothetical protein
MISLGLSAIAPAATLLSASATGTAWLVVREGVGGGVVWVGGAVGVLAAIGRLAVGTAPDVCAAGVAEESDNAAAFAASSRSAGVRPRGWSGLSLS